MKIKLVTLLILFPYSLWAKDYHPETKPNDHFIGESEQLKQLQRTNINSAQAKPNPKAPIQLDKESLLQNPQLLKRAMDSVLLTKQIEGLKIILPIYTQLADADPILINYAQALIAYSNGNYQRAIRYYRDIIAKEPKMSAVRFDLAMALYQNRQRAAAADQFRRLQSQEGLPKPVAQFIQQALNTIKKEESWQFNTNFYYRQENNINNVPKQQKITFGNGTLTFPKAQKAHGIHLDIGVKKRFNLNSNLYTNLQFNANSDFYWDNHQYDDLSLRAGLGFGYQDAILSAEIQPFIKKRFYGTKPYSLSSGASTAINYQINPKWQVSNFLEWSYENFKGRSHLNGQRKFIGLSTIYTPNPQQYWSFGVNHYDSQAKSAEDSYHRSGVFISWGQEWSKGLSSNLTLSASRGHYDGVDFFNIKRVDKDYSSKLSLWHRGIHYGGITPRLVWMWEKTDSNHFYYRKKKNTINIEFSKSF